MSRYSESDPYLDPATGVLKNRLNIDDEASLGLGSHEASRRM
jgi:hypothetical protein